MESFQPSGASTHRPLQGKEIRIVTLHSGSFDDPVFCTLDYVVLDGPRDDYVAISYAWGDPTQTEDINLNGHAYPVTLNLRSALANLRNKDEPRRLWIDSICINQQDLAERNAQVARMRDIFAYAAKVHIWLGDYGPKFTKDEWHQALHGTLYHHPMHGRTADEIAIWCEDERNYITFLRQHSMVCSILRRPWFERVWVIQEIAVRHRLDAHDDGKIRFFLGHLSFSWAVVEDSIYGTNYYLRHLLDMDGQRPPPFMWARMAEKNNFNEIRRGWYLKCQAEDLAKNQDFMHVSQHLAVLLSMFSLFKATDPRDRIYSLLGLLVGPGTVPDELAPDYSKPVDEVFQAYTVWILENSPCVDVLSLSSGHRPGLKCPSWVPDFQGQTQSFHMRPVDPDYPNPAKALQGSQILEVDALAIAFVQDVGKRCEILAQCKGGIADVWEAYRKYIVECENWIGHNEARSGHGRQSARTKLRNYFGQSLEAKINGAAWFPTPVTAINLNVLPRSAGFTCAQLYDFSVAEDACMESSLRGHTVGGVTVSWGHSYADHIANEFDGLTPFMCDNGELEFCNNKWDVPKPGDVLCLLRGSSKQYILRSSDTWSHGRWVIVGTTYNDAEFSRAVGERLRRHLNIPSEDENDDEEDEDDEEEEDDEEDEDEDEEEEEEEEEDEDEDEEEEEEEEDSIEDHDDKEGSDNNRDDEAEEKERDYTCYGDSDHSDDDSEDEGMEAFIKEHNQMREDLKTIWAKKSDKIFKALIC